MALIVTNQEERRILLRTYASNIDKRSLKMFSKKIGYGNDFIGIYSKEDMEEDPYEFQNELSEIKSNQILLWAKYPAAPVEENLYLNFDEFYAYLVEVVNERIAETPSDKAEYEHLLSEVKTALGL
ncbi:hypothetical protein Hs30E_17800 [Lactococcus hodotermopsidis]|uniref:CDI immunity protein domain-containing protein n=1 Tax=Pseudolactococcus hodotermopsidis TaxID=2709157 RepID=A0A6A0BCS6_9LACT|nr:hypothetical protein [Lactococcus hodotermopsidis]GFH43229.1 hypothetical protein Hs30E_17800 [Lactococcus hodotermopsidis]